MSGHGKCPDCEGDLLPVALCEDVYGCVRCGATRHLPPSPERTKVWRCPACPNTTEFVGRDHRGVPGEEDCECGAHENDWACTCEVLMRQEFVVNEHGDCDYQAHDGGYGADIGSYTQINCGACGALVWLEPNVEEVR